MESRTTKSSIKSALRRLFLRSRERGTAIKRDGYTCQKCGKKQSKKIDAVVKVEVHHKDGIDNWDEVISLIQEKLLCSPDELTTLCVDCHKEEK